MRTLRRSEKRPDGIARAPRSARMRRAAQVNPDRLRLLGLAAVCILALAACGQTPEPTLSVAATPTVIPATGAPSLSPTPTRGAPVRPSPSRPVAPSPSPPSPPASFSPWPMFLRELDFSIAVGNSHGPRALAVHPGLDRIYARTWAQAAGAGTDIPGHVTVLDRVSGEVLAVVETGLDSYSEGALAVDTARNVLYAVNPGETTASVLAADTLRLLATLQGVDRLALDAERGHIYVAGLASLRVLDPTAYNVLQEIPVSYAPQFLGLAMDPAESRVYLAYQDPSGYSLAQYEAATLQVRVVTNLPGRPDDLLPDPNRDRIYVALNDGEQSLIWILDGDGQLVEARALGDWLQRTHLALDPAGDRLFLGREVYGDNGITVLDLRSGQDLIDIPLDLAPSTLTWDAEAGRLWISHTYADKISVVDIEAGETVATFPTALELVGLAVDPERGHLYITDTAGRLHVLDSETDEELTTLPGEGRIAVDSRHGRLYTGGEGAGRVRVFDADALQQTGQIQTKAKPVADAYHGGLYLVQNGVYLASLETMTVTAAISDTLPEVPGYSPNPAAVDAVVDPGSGRVFVLVNNGVPGSNNGNYLYVYEAETYRKVLTDTERSPSYVDIDPATGRAYIARIHLAGQSISLLAFGREYTARVDAVFGELRVDPALRRLYLSIFDNEEGILLLFDAENLDVLGSVPIPGQFTLRALDPQRHLLYLATPDGQVQIWSATGGELARAAEPMPGRPAAEDILEFFRGFGDTPLFTGSLYRSEDEGESWQRISHGLPRRGVQEVVVSPGFARDETLFAVLFATDQGLGLWKSTDAGKSWHMANRGLTDLAVTDLAISPDFTLDETLYATARRGGLFRSTDGGRSWLGLSGRYHASDTYSQPPGGVFVSPTFGQDHTVFVSHYGLQRSTDGGETWARVLPELSSLAFSPDFAADRTLFGWAGSGGVLRSTDGGDTWQGASAGLDLAGFGSGRVIVSPDFSTSQTVYFVWTPSSSGPPVQFFRSTDGAATWERLAGEPPQAATPVQLSADGAAFLALDREGRLVRWPVGELDWRAATLPPLNEITINQLILSPNFVDDHTLWALSEGAGVLRSADAGLTWTDTRFPLRMTYGLPPELVVVPPQNLLVGSLLGLYHSDRGGAWVLGGRGLPQGRTTTSPEIGADGSLRVLVSGEGEDEGGAVFLSTDAGRTWTQPIPALPQPVVAEDLRFSPAFATDRTAFLALTYGRPVRTVNGGEWQPFGPPGEWALSALHLSPVFDRDRLIWVRLQDNRLWRSNDGGDRWTEVSGPWAGEAPMGVIPGTGYTLDALTFSPAFAQDSVLLTRAGGALYRSTDQGTTWTRVLDLGLPSVQAAFTPDYALDGTIYLLQGRTLHRSIDRGQTWRALPLPPWSDLDEVTLLLSPTFSQDYTLLVWTRTGQVYQSRDGAQSWRDVSRGLPPVNIRLLLFSPGYAVDGLLYLVPHDLGLYTRVGSDPWIASAEAGPPPTPALPPTRVPQPLPSPTPSPVACASEPVQFRAVWQQVRTRLGCPEQPAESVALAEQAFEHGRMIWDSSTRQIYVLLESGIWQAFADTFVEGVDVAYDPTLPPPPQQPQRGFGKVWREQLGGTQAVIGWALEVERPVSGWGQRFDRGLLVWTDTILAGGQGPGSAYLLYDEGTWQAIFAPPP